MMQPHIGKDSNETNQQLARTLVSGLRAASVSKQRYCVVLPGGKTPELFFRVLADDFRDAPWSNAHFFFGDERAVGPNHIDSNYRVAKTNLFDPLHIPEACIHRMRGEEKNLDVEADRYADELREFVAPNATGIPCFNFVILGLGADGHVASLFPNSKALNEEKRWVVPTLITKLCSWRLTLTFPVLNAASRLAILVTGEKKHAIVDEILGEGVKSMAVCYPVQRLRPKNGVDWFLDEAAAAGLRLK